MRHAEREREEREGERNDVRHTKKSLKSTLIFYLVNALGH
jgi:hypothetical protein